MDNTISPSSSSSLLCVPLEVLAQVVLFVSLKDSCCKSLQLSNSKLNQLIEEKKRPLLEAKLMLPHKEAEHNKLHNVVSHLKFIRKKKKLRQIHNRSASQRRSVGSVLKLAAGLDAELEGEIKTIIVQMTQIRQQIQSTQAYIEYFEPPMQSEPSLHWEVKWADGSHDYHECRIPRTFFN